MFQNHLTGHDYLQAHLFKIGLADSPLCHLCKSVPMTGSIYPIAPALLHVLSQDNCGVLLPARVTSALYWTARHLMSERTLVGREFELKQTCDGYLNPSKVSVELGCYYSKIFEVTVGSS
ncbi:hypothetical protein TNCV_166311 [Trichonephila clavipes]|nr:hypothetical protein TNCV_166311 [Trichonephila clavipes]